MQKIRSFLLFFLFTVSLTVPGYANDQRIYGTDSSEYKTLSLLNSLAEGPPLSDSGPWSLAELRNMLGAVDPDRLGTPGTASRNIYAALEEQLEPNDRPPSITFTARLNAEVYAHTNSTEFFDADEEWAYDYTKRAPVLEALISMHFTDHAFGGMEYDLRNNRFHFDTEDTTGFFGKTLATNLLFDDKPENINYTAPWRAYLSLGSDNWTFQFGRDTIRWGSGFLGNLFINDHADFHEYARLTAFNNAFKFTSVAMIFDHPDTYAVGTETSPKSSDPITGFKLFIAHRLELPITRRLRLAISEGMMVQSPAGDEETSDTTIKFNWLNPLMIYHNYYMAGTSNSLAGISLTANVAEGLSAYGELVIDEISAPTESNTKPNAFGYLGGITFTRPALSEHLLTLSLEAAYTDPYLYLRADGINFLIAQRQPVNNNLILADEDFLGFPIGPDSFIAALKAELHSLDSWRLATALIYLQKGTIDQYSTYQTGDDAYALVSPTTGDLGQTDKNAVEHRLIWSVDGRHPITEKISAGYRADWIHRWNPENRKENPYATDFQTSVVVSVGL